MENKLEIKYIKIEDLILNKDNPKKHPEEQIDKIAKSIKKFGFKIPILIDEKNRVIAGHGRLLAAKKLKLKEVPCIYIKGLKEEELTTLMIADNKVSESDWDTEKLFDLFDIIKKGNKSLLNITGFSESEINNLNLDYSDLASEVNDLELEHLETIEWTAKFKNEKEFEDVKNAIMKIKQKNGLGCFKSDYSNGKALQKLCVECEDEEDCNKQALKLLAKKYEKKNTIQKNKLKKK